MKHAKSRAFTLVELIIAIVFLGVVLGPLLVYVARIHELNHAVGEQARRESWRSFSEQAVAIGINPALAPALAASSNAAVPELTPIAIEADDTPLVAGLARIVPIRVLPDASWAESRLGGSGFQIGAGGAVTPRTIPTAPLLPIMMPAPVVSPADGAVLPAAALSVGAANAPYTLAITAVAAPGSQVQLSLDRPHVAAAGIGSASQSVTAVDLLGNVGGSAWTEFLGDVRNGDRSIILPDGRIRWLVTTPERRTQIYEPSSSVRFSYKIDLGLPVLRYGSLRLDSGSATPVDYPAYLGVRDGTTVMTVDFPESVKAAFGPDWGVQSIGFQLTFNDVAGPFSGDLQAFFLADATSVWTDQVVIVASPVVPPGALAGRGQWQLSRAKLPLGVPVLSTVADPAGFHTPGTLQFAAPDFAGEPLGRLSFENGTLLSTGTTLSLSLIP